MRNTATSQRRQRFTRSSRVDIIPLMDVIFLLLAFFIFVTINMVMQKGIFVNLAKAESGETAASETESIVITVDAEGEFYFNKEEVSETELQIRLQTARRENPEQPVYINGDGDSAHRQVMKAVDIARQAGFENAVFTVEPVK